MVWRCRPCVVAGQGCGSTKGGSPATAGRRACGRQSSPATAGRRRHRQSVGRRSPFGGSLQGCVARSPAARTQAPPQWAHPAAARPRWSSIRAGPAINSAGTRLQGVSRLRAHMHEHRCHCKRAGAAQFDKLGQTVPEKRSTPVSCRTLLPAIALRPDLACSGAAVRHGGRQQHPRQLTAPNSFSLSTRPLPCPGHPPGQLSAAAVHRGSATIAAACLRGRKPVAASSPPLAASSAAPGPAEPNVPAKLAARLPWPPWWRASPPSMRPPTPRARGRPWRPARRASSRRTSTRWPWWLPSGPRRRRCGAGRRLLRLLGCAEASPGRPRQPTACPPPHRRRSLAPPPAACRR